ncbi:MAG: hypothetical protein BWZ03_00758 [bacterium ADurb.BinA186]|nr:MAG: hypothetical protein BWZ03_00758 [bacterium ADurb.BinA186]
MVEAAGITPCVGVHALLYINMHYFSNIFLFGLALMHFFVIMHINKHYQ